MSLSLILHACFSCYTYHISDVLYCFKVYFLKKSLAENELVNHILWRSGTEVRHYAAKLRSWFETSPRHFLFLQRYSYVLDFQRV